ncbi:MAG TPA: branched-chain amino acid ABC transporter permease [Micromonosporaceae bacterium]
MTRLLQYIFDGLSEGAPYSLLALSLVVVFRATSHLNFAQGEMAMFSAFVVWQLHTWGVPLALAVAGGILFGFVSAGLAEVVLIRPVNRKSPYAALVVMIALFLVLSTLADVIWGGDDPEIMPGLFPNQPTDFVRIFGAYWRYQSLGILLVAIVLAGGLLALFKFTKFGLAMRAVASNTASARLVGVNTTVVVTASWAIAGALGAVAAALVGSSAGELTPSLMFNVFVYAAAAATLGGFDSLGGAIFSGLAIGVIQNIAAGYAPGWIGNQMQLGVALVLIVVVLLVKPSGLFGQVKVERV